MNIKVLLGSNRHIGKHKELMKNLSSDRHTLDYIELSKSTINPCTACEACRQEGSCILPNDDDFNTILDEIKSGDVLFIVTPVYAPIPSKLAAFFERVLSISFFGGKLGGHDKPLFDKQVGIVSYGANGLYSSDSIKIMIQQFFTDDYDFESITYPYIDNEICFENKTLTEYLQEIVNSL